MKKHSDRIMEISDTEGLSDFTLSGATVGYQKFSEVYTDSSDTFSYCIEAQNEDEELTGEWEVGTGYISSEGKLVRYRCQCSSNHNTFVNFASGRKVVWLTLSAEDILGFSSVSGFDDKVQEAIETINSTKDTAVESVNTAVENLDTEKTSAISAIDTSRDSAIEQIESLAGSVTGIPDQSGHADEVLTTDGTTASWTDLDITDPAVSPDPSTVFLNAYGGTETVEDEAMVRISAFRKTFIDIAHPIGSYYWSSDSTDPSQLFEDTTWEQITDKFIYASGTHAVGDTGGEETHTLTVDEMPKHGHVVDVFSGDVSSATYTAQTIGSDGVTYSTASGRGSVSTNYAWNSSSFKSYGSRNADGSGDPMGNAEYTGGGGAHNNMPPYEVAYCWRRTA